MATIPSFLDKTSISNIVAGIVVVIGIAYGVWIQDTQLVLSIAMAGVGFLFGKSTVKG